MAIDSTSRQSRRALLFGAAGGVAALAAHALGRPAPVSADDPNDVELGAFNLSTATTIIECNEPGNLTVLETHAAQDGGTGVLSTSPVGVGVLGSSFSSRGVFGRSNGTGIGVAGESTSGYGGEFTGGKAQLRLVPKSTGGKPKGGSHSKGEIYMDSKGALFVCTANGTPGTWRKLTSTAT
jgi:hypothetical protein